MVNPKDLIRHFPEHAEPLKVASTEWRSSLPANVALDVAKAMLVEMQGDSALEQAPTSPPLPRRHLHIIQGQPPTEVA